MALSYNDILKNIDEHLSKSGKRYYSEFYIGVTQNAVKQLFEEHHVDKENSWWIYTTAISSEDAKKVENYYKNLGMRSGGTSDDNSKMVYCYVVTPTTTE